MSHLIACVQHSLCYLYTCHIWLLVCSIHYAICTHVTSDCSSASICCAICMHVTSYYLHANIHCAICMHVTSDSLCASIHCAVCMHVIWLCAIVHCTIGACHIWLLVCQYSLCCLYACSSDCLFACLHCTTCMCVESDCLCVSKVLLCCRSNLSGGVIALNCIAASVVFLLALHVITPWISPFLVTGVMC